MANKLQEPAFTGPPAASNEPAMDNHDSDSQSSSEVIQWLLDCQRRGIRIVVVGNRLRIQPWARLSAEDRGFITQNREAIKATLRAGLSIAPANAEPVVLFNISSAPKAEPLPMVGRHQLTEDDLVHVLANEGDELVAAYRNGTLPRVRVIAKAVAWHRQFQSVGGRYGE